jgi:hypothetical protein
MGKLETGSMAYGISVEAMVGSNFFKFILSQNWLKHRWLICSKMAQIHRFCAKFSLNF